MKLGDLPPGSLFECPSASAVVYLKTDRERLDDDTVGVIGTRLGVIGTRHGTFTWWPKDTEVDPFFLKLEIVLRREY